jgi:hypothetical protein
MQNYFCETIRAIRRPPQRTTVSPPHRPTIVNMWYPSRDLPRQQRHCPPQILSPLRSGGCRFRRQVLMVALSHLALDHSKRVQTKLGIHS